MTMFPAFFLASVLVVADVPVPSLTPAPTALASAEPTLTLPEIGRVKAVVLPCSIMRDLVIPAFVAARHSDARFADVGSKLPQYAQAVDEGDPNFGAEREMLLSRIDQQLSNMMKEKLTIAKALGDPRLANPTDPQVQAERAGLQQIYDAQSDRAARLSEFVQRQQVAISRGQLADNGEFSNPRNPTPTPTPAPAPGSSNPPNGQPVMRGIALGDADTMRQWTADIKATIARSENSAAKAFIPIASACR